MSVISGHLYTLVALGNDFNFTTLWISTLFPGYKTNQFNYTILFNIRNIVTMLSLIRTYHFKRDSRIWHIFKTESDILKIWWKYLPFYKPRNIYILKFWITHSMLIIILNPAKKENKLFYLVLIYIGVWGCHDAEQRHDWAVDISLTRKVPKSKSELKHAEKPRNPVCEWNVYRPIRSLFRIVVDRFAQYRKSATFESACFRTNRCESQPI